jgi:molecular chaperone DnaK (HSP70)
VSGKAYGRESAAKVKSSVSSDQQRHKRLLALDFGTSFSKACVKRGEEIIPLDLGVSAGGGRVAQPNPYVLVSTVFVRDGRFLFGPTAYEASLTAPEGRRRFDSPKLMFNRENLSSLKQTVGEDTVPGDIKFTQWDIILLYLAYFTAMVENALERKGVGGDVPRRYTVPGWAPVRAEMYSRALRELLGRAHILAGVFRNQWGDGIPVRDARKSIDDVGKLKTIPNGLIKEGLHEATAAGLCALNKRWQKDRLFIVMDIGAGTTDFAAFVLYRSRRDEERDFHFAQIRGTDVGVDQAGSVLDEALLKLALDKSILDERRIRAAEISLRRQITESKEAIFREPFYVDLKLDRRIVETVERDELLNSRPVIEMRNRIAGSFRTVINAIGVGALSKYEYAVDVYLTGGGAGLPFAGDLVSGYAVDGRKKLQVKRHEGAPGWMRESGESWLPYFSQLAVAIGAVVQNDLPGEVGPYSGASLNETPLWRSTGNLWCG